MEDISKRQTEEAAQDRVDYNQVDTEVVNDVRHKRKRTRKDVDDKVRQVADDCEEDEDDFRMNIDKAAQKFKVRRKKKHIFNDAGVKIEPFKIDESTVQNNGGIITMREGGKDSDDEDDPWLQSIKEQQERMMKEQAKNQVDSDEYESSDNDDGKSDQPDNFAAPKEPKTDIKEVISMKKRLLEFLLPKENVQKALKRLKPTSEASGFHKIQTKKKNVRKRQKSAENGEESIQTNEEQNTKFNALMEIVNKLFDMNYHDVYRDDKETIAYEISQDELKLKREADQKALKENGWCYKIEYTDGVTKAKQFGPFPPSQMQEWNKSGYFKETDEQICAFKRYKDIQNEDVDWVFIDEIDHF